MRKAILGAASALALASPAVAADYPVPRYSEVPRYEHRRAQPILVEEPAPVIVVRRPVIVAPMCMPVRFGVTDGAIDEGREYPFTLRMVKAPEPDEDGEPIGTMVVDWVPAPPGGARPQPDPWAQARRQDQRTAGLRLKRVLMGALADQGGN
jgi:hypothetical protein